MLLKNYKKEIFRPECNPQFQSLHCFAYLDEDISEVLPYLNTALGGAGYTLDPPSLMLRIRGQLITLHPKKIAINALKDEEQADKILEWLRREINETWERHNEITPSYCVAPRPQPMEILKLLPKTNCKECGQGTCIIFASLVMQGIKGAQDCPPLTERNRLKLEEYLNKFTFNDL
ncbi:MAG: (Fe-S)-binding protein [Deltaproteobacteria bacterium]